MEFYNTNEPEFFQFLSTKPYFLFEIALLHASLLQTTELVSGQNTYSSKGSQSHSNVSAAGLWDAVPWEPPIMVAAQL